MRAVLAALALLVAQPFDEARGPDFAYGPFDETSKFGPQGTPFYAPLHTDEIGPGVWAVQGPPAPTGCWWGDDPAGSGTVTAGTWTLTSATSAVESPFGTSAGDYIGARRFDTNDYYTNDDSSVGNLDSDLSVIAVVAHRATASATISKADVADDGWEMFSDGTGNFDVYVENDAGTNATSTKAAVLSDGSWNTMGFSLDLDGNLIAYLNGVAGNTAVTPAAPITITNAMVVGAIRGGVLYKAKADIALICWWEGTILSGTAHAAIHNALSSMSASTGPDIVYTRATTGMPGAPDATGQYHAFGAGLAAPTPNGTSVEGARTNYALNFLDKSALTVVGDAVVTVNTASGPWSVYAGGAEADTLSDDNDTDGGGADDGDADYEGVRLDAQTTYTSAYTCSTRVKAGTETGATLLITSDGTGSKTCTFSGLDVPATATTVGGVVSAETLAGWARIDCSTTIGGVPTATTCDLLVGDAAADTGTIIASASGAWRLGYVPGQCPTAGTAATCNADNLAMPLASTGLLDGTGKLLTPVKVCLDYTPTITSVVDAYLWSIKDDATGADIWYGRLIVATGRLYLYAQSTEEGVERIVAYQTTGTTWVAGTTYNICYLVSPTPANVRIWINNASVPLTTGTVIGTPPNALDNLYWGSWGVTSSSARGGVAKAKVQRP